VEEVVIPLASFAMVVAIVGIVQMGKSIRYYLDWRMRMADRQIGARDGNVVQAINELRTEVAALRQHESEAVLSFDSTLQTLEARLKHLENRALSEGPASHASIGVAAGPGREETLPLGTHR
jgi:hypothetical protein